LLLQDANVDPLIRQQTLGHKPTNSNGLGMTGNYTHTRQKTKSNKSTRYFAAGQRRWRMRWIELVQQINKKIGQRECR